jgi:hypothetical protein
VLFFALYLSTCPVPRADAQPAPRPTQTNTSSVIPPVRPLGHLYAFPPALHPLPRRRRLPGRRRQRRAPRGRRDRPAGGAQKQGNTDGHAGAGDGAGRVDERARVSGWSVRRLVDFFFAESGGTGVGRGRPKPICSPTQPLNRSTNQPTAQPTNRSTNKPTNQPPAPLSNSPFSAPAPAPAPPPPPVPAASAASAPAAVARRAVRAGAAVAGGTRRTTRGRFPPRCGTRATRGALGRTDGTGFTLFCVLCAACCVWVASSFR